MNDFPLTGLVTVCVFFACLQAVVSSEDQSLVSWCIPVFYYIFLPLNSSTSLLVFFLSKSLFVYVVCAHVSVGVTHTEVVLRCLLAVAFYLFILNFSYVSECFVCMKLELHMLLGYHVGAGTQTLAL